MVVFDGKHHAVDSNEISFVTAARHAVQEAAQAAKPVVLEPLVTPDGAGGRRAFRRHQRRLSGRRGRVTGTDSPQPGWTEITSQIPMAEMEGFESRLKSDQRRRRQLQHRLQPLRTRPFDVQQRLARERRQARRGTVTGR